MKMIKVLIVDDSVTIRAIFEELLMKDREIQLVGKAADAAEAIELVKRTLPHVIALDINMPGINGIEFLDLMASMEQRPAVVVVSSSALHDSPICTEAFDHGAIACFDKAGMVANGQKLIALLKAAANGKISRAESRDESVTIPT